MLSMPQIANTLTKIIRLCFDGRKTILSIFLQDKSKAGMLLAYLFVIFYNNGTHNSPQIYGFCNIS
ncbi:hypothetical protein CAL7102_06651 [Dulcicalothrix desertica PCC 7102]|nr:hypothetical protein CAL7102_06651 [Dulcicalothrix desertica PCC 7102]